MKAMIQLSQQELCDAVASWLRSEKYKDFQAVESIGAKGDVPLTFTVELEW